MPNHRKTEIHSKEQETESRIKITQTGISQPDGKGFPSRRQSNHFLLLAHSSLCWKSLFCVHVYGKVVGVREWPEMPCQLVCPFPTCSITKVIMRWAQHTFAGILQRFLQILEKILNWYNGAWLSMSSRKTSI